MKRLKIPNRRFGILAEFEEMKGDNNQGKESYKQLFSDEKQHYNKLVDSDFGEVIENFQNVHGESMQEDPKRGEKIED